MRVPGFDLVVSAVGVENDHIKEEVALVYQFVFCADVRIACLLCECNAWVPGKHN